MRFEQRYLEFQAGKREGETGADEPSACDCDIDFHRTLTLDTASCVASMN
jgi:hypothetical protein